LILGLPEETWETHIDANKQLMSLGFEVHNYNLHLLPGTAMDTDESRAKNIEITGWRLHDNAFGVYDDKPVFEGQEVVLQTPTISRREMGAFRYIHWLTQLMWGRRYYVDFLQLLWKNGIHPFDMVTEIYSAMERDTGSIGIIFEEFKQDYGLEDFGSEEALIDYWGKPENLQRLKEGSYGKLNAVYTHKIVLHHGEEFNEFIFRVARDVLDKLGTKDQDECLKLCKEVNRYNLESRIALNSDLSLVEQKQISFDCDILSWKLSNYENAAPAQSDDTKFNYEFYIPPVKKAVLETKISQFGSHNLNLTWRKMTEYSNPDEFFYAVRPA
jgi:hypothetical protein